MSKINIDTLIGAVIAALINLLTGFMALLNQDSVETLADIGAKPVLILVVGALVALLKDYQALTVRRIAAQVTGSKNEYPKAYKVKLPGYTLVMAVILVFLVMGVIT